MIDLGYLYLADSLSFLYEEKKITNQVQSFWKRKKYPIPYNHIYYIIP